MNILTLSIKQKFFDEIKEGKKKKETREIRPSTSKRYISYKYNGKSIKEDQVPLDADPSKIVCEPVRYDAIRFVTGEYKGKRPSMLVQVTGAKIYILTNEETNEEIVYEENGREYVAAQIDYTLGKIIEV